MLPERRFTKPLARAVVEQRRRLAEDPRDRLQVARAIDAITLEPEEFIEDLQVFLGLRSAYWRLKSDGSRSARNLTVAQLWNIALRIEDGNLTDAERALRAAQDRLQKALRARRLRRGDPEAHAGAASGAGAVPRAALQAGPERSRPCRGMDRNNQFMTPQDLEQMLRNLENMARSGNRDMAQQMLSQLRDLLDRLQSGRMADQGQNQRMGQMMDEFGNIIGRQQQLLDDTFGQQRQQGHKASVDSGASRASAANRVSKGNKASRGSVARVKARVRGRMARARMVTRRVRSATASASCATCWAGCSAACASSGSGRRASSDGAGEAMDRAERALRNGDLDGATQEEARALEQLRQGAREMAQQMLRQMPSRYGLNEPQGELDPMGRPPQRTDGPDPAWASRCRTRSTSSGRARSWRSCAGASASRPGRPSSSSIWSGCSSGSESGSADFRALPLMVADALAIAARTRIRPQHSR